MSPGPERRFSPRWECPRTKLRGPLIEFRTLDTASADLAGSESPNLDTVEMVRGMYAGCFMRAVSQHDAARRLPAQVVARSVPKHTIGCGESPLGLRDIYARGVALAILTHIEHREFKSRIGLRPPQAPFITSFPLPPADNVRATVARAQRRQCCA